MSWSGEHISITKSPGQNHGEYQPSFRHITYLKMANQAWQLTAPGAITLNDLETPIPKPGSYQALVRIHAVALNPGDNLLANFSDKYPVKAKLGQILGMS